MPKIISAAFKANLCPKGTDPFCRLTLPTLSYKPYRFDVRILMRLWVSLLQVSLSNPFPGKKAFPKLVAAHKKLWRVGFTFTSGRTSDFSYYQQEKRCPCQNHSSWEQQMRFHWQDHSSENMLCWSLRYRLGTDDIVDWEETYPCTLAGSKEPYSSTALIESSLLPPRYSHRLAMIGQRQSCVATSTAYLLDSNDLTRNRYSIQRRMQSIFEVGNFGRWVITHSWTGFDFHDHRPTVSNHQHYFDPQSQEMVRIMRPEGSFLIARSAYQKRPTEGDKLDHFPMSTIGCPFKVWKRKPS